MRNAIMGFFFYAFIVESPKGVGYCGNGAGAWNEWGRRSLNPKVGQTGRPGDAVERVRALLHAR
jgi:hypothetical protein